MAPRSAGDKRERLLEAARALIHQQGFNQTTLADIAKESGVPLGNVYYYFKTKDEIAGAVIDEYRQHIDGMLRELEESEPDPRKRLLFLIKRTSNAKDELATHGCPIGSLCQELNKCRCDTPLAASADDIFGNQIKWTTRQFKALGKKDAADLAVELIASLQGTILLANATRSPEMADRQLHRLARWITEM
jgi:AcrR family transcriptional regulator